MRQVAVITGASAGVGRATARAFADRGFDVALLARGQAGLEGAARDIRDAGGRALLIPTDVSQFDQVDRAATQVEAELGPIDVWVNDAMTTVFAPAWEVTPADFQRAVEVTFLGQVWGTMAALSKMRPRDRGQIVNVGSALAFIGIPLQSAYCSSKFACRGFFESLRAELIHEKSNIRVSMVHLPAVNTPQFDWCESIFDVHPQPAPPIYQPEIPAKFHRRGGARRAPAQDHRVVEQDPRVRGPARSRVRQPVRRDRRVGEPAHRPEGRPRPGRATSMSPPTLTPTMAPTASSIARRTASSPRAF